MSAIFDFPSLIVVILLFICVTTFTRSLYPKVFDGKVKENATIEHSGLLGLCWKASRIGERLSPYIATACIFMAIQILFFKA